MAEQGPGHWDHKAQLLFPAHGPKRRGLRKWQSLLSEAQGPGCAPSLGNGSIWMDTSSLIRLDPAPQRALVIQGWLEHCLETGQAVAWGVGRNSAYKHGCPKTLALLPSTPPGLLWPWSVPSLYFAPGSPEGDLLP